MQHTTIAVDLAKSVFQVAISHHPGRVDEEHRLSRARFLSFFADRPTATSCAARSLGVVLPTIATPPTISRRWRPGSRPAGSTRSPWSRRGSTDPPRGGSRSNGCAAASGPTHSSWRPRRATSLPMLLAILPRMRSPPSRATTAEQLFVLRGEDPPWRHESRAEHHALGAFYRRLAARTGKVFKAPSTATARKLPRILVPTRRIVIPKLTTTTGDPRRHRWAAARRHPGIVARSPRAAYDPRGTHFRTGGRRDIHAVPVKPVAPWGRAIERLGHTVHCCPPMRFAGMCAGTRPTAPMQRRCSKPRGTRTSMRCP